MAHSHRRGLALEERRLRQAHPGRKERPQLLLPVLQCEEHLANFYCPLLSELLIYAKRKWGAVGSALKTKRDLAVAEVAAAVHEAAQAGVGTATADAEEGPLLVLSVHDAIAAADEAEEALRLYVAEENSFAVMEPDEDEYEAKDADADSMPATVATAGSAVSLDALRRQVTGPEPELNMCCDTCGVTPNPRCKASARTSCRTPSPATRARRSPWWEQRPPPPQLGPPPPRVQRPPPPRVLPPPPLVRPPPPRRRHWQTSGQSRLENSLVLYEKFLASVGPAAAAVAAGVAAADGGAVAGGGVAAGGGAAAGVSALRAYLEGLAIAGKSPVTLRAECQRRGLKVSGTKPEMVERVEAHAIANRGGYRCATTGAAVADGKPKDFTGGAFRRRRMERLSLGFREATTARPLEPGQPRQNKKQGVQQPSTNKKKADSAAVRARAAARKQDAGAWRPPHAPLRDIHKQKQSDVLKKKNEGSIPLLLDCLVFFE